MKTHSPAQLAAPDAGLMGFVRGVNNFFFQPSDTATLGLIRLSAGFLILWVHLMYSYDLYRLIGKDAWVSHDLATEIRTDYPIAPTMLGWQQDTPDLPKPTEAEARKLSEYRDRWLGSFNDPTYDPRWLWVRGQHVWSVWFHVTDPTWVAVIHAGILLCMLLFALGLWTPATGLVTWLGMLSYVNRASTTFFGMDTIMNVLVLYLTLAHLFAQPGTAALSLDRLLWRRRQSRLGLARPDAPGDTTSSSATFAIRMMQIHFCIIYAGSGLSKLMGSSWWNGTAIWYTVANPEFAALHLQRYRDMIAWLARHRVLWELSMTGGAMFTLCLEIGFPFLVWYRPLRWLMVIGAVMLHTGIALFMGLTGFSLMMLALLVSFIPPSTVRQLLGLAQRVPALAAAAVPAPSAAPAVGVR
jgi:hypothetical protein